MLTTRVAAAVTSVDPNTAAQEKEAAAIAQRAAEKAQAEAEKAREESQRALEEWQRNVESATESLTSSLEEAAQNVADAAERWVGSIKERTQYEQAVSVNRLVSNADRQTRDLTELQEGIGNLKARGVSQEVLDALGIDNIADLRQVRKLVKANDSDLGALTQSVSKRDASAIDLAKAAEDKRTQTNITVAILAAATTLGFDVSKEQAAAISNQFNITPGVNTEDLVGVILNAISSGKIAR